MIEKLVPAVQDAPDADAFLKMIGRVRCGGQAVAAALLHLLEDGPQEPRCIAAEHLGKPGAEARAAVAAPERAIEGDDESLRYAARIALRKITK